MWCVMPVRQAQKGVTSQDALPVFSKMKIPFKATCTFCGAEWCDRYPFQRSWHNKAMKDEHDEFYHVGLSGKNHTMSCLTTLFILMTIG
jgi:hypothetical protein